MTRFPVEPWNTASNLIFLLALVVYARRTGLDMRRYPLLVVALPVLLIGFLGGTVYHASRSANLWLFMDFIPITVLALLAAYHFWRGVVHSRLLAGVLVLTPALAVRAARSVFDAGAHHLHISLGYIGLAVTILLPAVLYCRGRGWREGWFLAAAFVSFAGAITFRIADSAALLPMGTHFLWHLLGGLSCILLMEFIYRHAALPRPSASSSG